VLTDGKCKYVETESFEEFFDGPLNGSRWDLGSMGGLFHCDRGTAQECTMALADNFQLAAPLPFYPNGNVSGASLLLSQDPCNNPFRRELCCANVSAHLRGRHPTPAGLDCANWVGAVRAAGGPGTIACPPPF